MGTEARVDTLRTSGSAAAIYLVFVTEPVPDWLSVVTQRPTETHLSGEQRAKKSELGSGSCCSSSASTQLVNEGVCAYRDSSHAFDRKWRRREAEAVWR
jgi:hypothetical protein